MAGLRGLIVGVCVVAGSIAFCRAEDRKPEAEAGSWIVLQQGLDKDAARYEIPLSLSESRFGPSGNQQSDKPFRRLGASENEFTHQVDFNPTPMGTQYSLLLRPAREIEWLGREESGYNTYRVAVLQGRDGEDPKTLKEGYASLGQSFFLPVEIFGTQLGLPAKQIIRGSLDFRFEAPRPELFRAYLALNLNASLMGSVMTDSAKVDVTVESPGSRRLEDRQIMVQVAPFDKRLRPDTASGKISDIISLQTSRLVVEKIMADYSRIGLAVVYGRLGERSPEELVNEARGIAARRPLPRFARVDLIRRRLVNLDDLCAETGESGRIVLVFGDRAPEVPGYYEASGGRLTAPLPMDEDLIKKTLSSGVETPLTLVFVCRRFDPATLYDRWLGTDPTFYVISDFSQPSYALASRGPGPYYARGMAGSGSQPESLRGKFALPEDKVSVLLVDGAGTVLHVEPDAQDKLERVLTGINEMIRSLSLTSDPNLPAGPAPSAAPAPSRRSR